MTTKVLDNRENARYKEIGHVNAPELCPLPGVLDDISFKGCKVHYSYPVVVDLENEYEIQVLPLTNQHKPPLRLVCVPQWAKECGGKTEVGFQIQYSPDEIRLHDFVEHLKEIEAESFPQIK